MIQKAPLVQYVTWQELQPKGESHYMGFLFEEVSLLGFVQISERPNKKVQAHIDGIRPWFGV